MTGFPEMLDGRVKTLHPKIHAGILADRRKPEHETQLADQGIEPFDLVVVNLYPFRETVASGADEDDVIEKIDIGGPAMVRAAAKNFASVGVVVSPSRYAEILDAIKIDGGLSLELRRALAAEAFAHTAAYDAAVAGWFASDDAAMPAFVGLAFEKVADLRYGENPHQRGALYRAAGGPGVLGGAEVLVEGKEMSFNNWLDVDAALTLAADLERLGPAAVIVKHNNPCGAAVQGSLAASYAAAFESDTVSAFGGIVAFGREADEDAARAMADVFTEVVVAPSFTDAALAAFAERKGLRVVRAPLPEPGGPRRARAARGRARPGRGRGTRERGRAGGRVDAATHRGRMARPAVRVDRLDAREVERDRVRAGPGDGRRRGRADVARGRVGARRSEGGGPREGLGDGERRVLPVPRRGRGRGGRRGDGRDPPRGFDPRRGGARGGRGCGGWPSS